MLRRLICVAHGELLKKDGDIKTQGKLPIDVYTAFFQAGIIEEPYYGDNENKVQC